MRRSGVRRTVDWSKDTLSYPDTNERETPPLPGPLDDTKTYPRARKNAVSSLRRRRRRRP